MMKPEDWIQQFPDASGNGIDSWIGHSESGNQWLVTMWFGDEDSGGELQPDEYAIELCLEVEIPAPGTVFGVTTQWQRITYDQLTSRADVLATFDQMKVTCD
jgi:hypothetical protein